jgi:hypothetical protein
MKTCQATKVCGCSKIPLNILITAFVIRLFMIFFGSRILDKSVYDLKYTDIDYNIFTDAAQLVVSGKYLYMYRCMHICMCLFIYLYIFLFEYTHTHFYILKEVNVYINM